MLHGMHAHPAPSDASPVSAQLRRAVAELHPAYFALVMATGIVSIVSHLLGLHDAATFLFWLNVVAYTVLSALYVARALLFPAQFASDLRSHQRAPGFFTAVAATCVVGLQLVLLRDDVAAAYALWWVGLVLWGVCTYGVFVLLSVRDVKPSLGDGINGGWLVAVVATQSVCVLGCRVLVARFPGNEGVLFVLTSLWLSGGMLYVWMISLIFYRYMFFRFAPADLMPPYWINMGAVAISVVAGTSLAAAAPDSAVVTAALPFVKGLTLMFWATATWWIPMLFLLGVWRHRVARFQFAYDPLYWGLVFPLGMYALCTYRIAGVFALPWLLWIARAFAVLALSAWLLTFLGLASRAVALAVVAARSLALRAAARVGDHAVLPPASRRRS